MLETSVVIVITIILIINSVFAFGLIGVIIGGSFNAPFVPSGKKTTKKMIEVAKIKKGDIIFDLGCGDGQIVFAAEKAGAGKSVGVEISPPIWVLAKIRQFFSKAKKSEIRLGNIFSQKDVSDADIIFCFLLPEVMKRIFTDIWPKMKPDARIISHAFSPKGMQIEHEIIHRCKEHGTVRVYTKK